MRRRDFVLTFGGLAASAWPVIVSAQQAAKSPTIGFMGAGTPVGLERLDQRISAKD